MKNTRLINYTEYSLVVVQGVIATFLLFLMIVFMSELRESKNKLPVMVQLLVWEETQTEIKKNTPTEIKPAPIKKKPLIKKPKNIIPKKPSITPIQDSKITEKSIPEMYNIEPDVQTKPHKNITPPRETLPNPVPLFKITEMPQFLHREVPVYPEAMRSMGKSSLVILDVLIDKKGKVRKVTILESGGEQFDKAAMKGMQASSFIPAKIDGKSVTVLLRFPVKFRLL